MSNQRGFDQGSITVALLTVSDSAARGEASDLSGPLLYKKLAEAGLTVVRADIIADDRQSISDWLIQAADVRKANLILTSGGVGLSSHNVTPEATRAVLEREVPGIAEAIRAGSIVKTPRAMLSRGIAGIRGRTLIINLSGEPREVTEQWECVEAVISDAVEALHTSEQPKVALVHHEQQPQKNLQSTMLGSPLSSLSKKK